MLGYVFTFLIIINITIVCCLFSKSIYKNEVQTSLDDSIELSMELLRTDNAKRFLNDPDVDITNNDNLNIINPETLNDLQTDFTNILTSLVDSKITDMEINFYAADENSKLLSVEVKAKFRYLDGSIGSVSSYKTMVITG